MKLMTHEKAALTAGGIALGVAVLGFFIANRDWHQEQAHNAAMTGRGQYK